MSLIANLMDAGSSNPQTQFVGFSRMGDLKALKKLFNAEAPKWKDYNGETAFFAASLSRRYDIMDWLLQNGADVNEKNNKGNTPLIQAVHDYIDLDAGLGRRKGYVLYPKAQNLALIKFLVLAGANLDATDAKGLTATDIAVARKIPDVADFIAENKVLRGEQLEDGCHAAVTVTARKPLTFKS